MRQVSLENEFSKAGWMALGAGAALGAVAGTGVLNGMFHPIPYMEYWMPAAIAAVLTNCEEPGKRLVVGLAAGAAFSASFNAAGYVVDPAFLSSAEHRVSVQERPSQAALNNVMTQRKLTFGK